MTTLTDAERMTLARAQVEALKTEQFAHVVAAVTKIIADREKALREETAAAIEALPHKDRFGYIPAAHIRDCAARITRGDS